MEIVSSEELNSVVAPILDQGLIKQIPVGKYVYGSVSQKFDYLKVIFNNCPYGSGSYYNIEPIELQNAIVNASLDMGDNFLYLSFASCNVEPNTPIYFKFPIQELLNEELYMLIIREKRIKHFRYEVLMYSPQGLWATLTGIDCYGTLGMTKEFIDRVRIFYPQLDEELDRQLLAFIRWCNDDPSSHDEWQYIPGDTTAYPGWCKVFMEYLCRMDISEKSNNAVDLIDAYRNLKV